MGEVGMSINSIIEVNSEVAGVGTKVAACK
jgi:hypothetical protein